MDETDTIEASASSRHIAIISMAGYSLGADTPAAFWVNLARGLKPLTEFSAGEPHRGRRSGHPGRSAGARPEAGPEDRQRRSTNELAKQNGVTCSDLLGAGEKDVEDDFFRLGGDSVLVMQLNARVVELMAVKF